MEGEYKQDISWIIIKLKDLVLCITNLNFTTIKISSSSNGNYEIYFPDQTEPLQWLITDDIAQLMKKLSPRPLLPLPGWSRGVGLIHNLRLIELNSVRYTRWKQELSQDQIYTLLSNWEIYDANNGNARSLIADPESFNGRLRLSGTHVLYQSSLTKNPDMDKTPIFKLRSGDPYEHNKRHTIDYFHRLGAETLIKKLNMMLESETGGFDMDSLTPLYQTAELLTKTVCKVEGALLSYRDSIAQGLTRLNEILEQLPDQKLIFSSLINRFTRRIIPRIEVKGNMDQIRIMIQNIIYQGISQYALTFTSDSTDQLSGSQNFKKLFFIIAAPMILLDLKWLERISDKNKKFYQALQKSIRIRNEYEPLRNYLLKLFQTDGILPMDTISGIGGHVSGLMMGQHLFHPIIQDKMLESVITLPRGSWYDKSTGKILEGGNTFAHRGEKQIPLFFQKSDSIIPSYPDIPKLLNEPRNTLMFEIFCQENCEIHLEEDFLDRKNKVHPINSVFLTCVR